MLYDELGRESHVFEQRHWTAGESRLSFDVTPLATGLYFARFTGSAGTAVQKYRPEVDTKAGINI